MSVFCATCGTNIVFNNNITTSFKALKNHRLNQKCQKSNILFVNNDAVEKQTLKLLSELNKTSDDDDCFDSGYLYRDPNLSKVLHYNDSKRLDNFDVDTLANIIETNDSGK